MGVRKRVGELTDLELAEAVRSIVSGLSQKELRRYFPAVTPNDLSRVGRTTKKLSARKRRAWEDIVTVWEEEGRPDALTLAERMGTRHPERVERLFHVLAHAAWRGQGVPLEKRLEVGEEIMALDGFTPEEKRVFRALARAVLEACSNASR